MMILDTNVLSEMMRPVPNERVQRWVMAQPRSAMFTTAISEAEILFGVEITPEGKRREWMREAAHKMFGRVMAERILSFDSAAAEAFGRIVARRRKLGRPISYADGQIVAIARREGAALVTRNAADFEECGVTLIDPWK